MPTTASVRWLPRITRRLGDDTLPFDPADFMPALKTRLLVLQPTPFCNIDCDYCYLPQRDSKARMSLHTVRLAARRLRDDGLLGPELTVVWHAGEPLTVPVAFYEAAFAVLADELGDATRLTHSIQTNGLLIDDRWCELFGRHQVSVGVSVDGPAALHDRHRRTRGGKGTHAAVLRGMARLRAHGIAFHAIAVVTDATFGQPDAFFDFFVDQQVSELGCNFDEAEGGHLQSSLSGRENAHRAFIERLLDRSLAAVAPTRRPASAAGGVAGPPSSSASPSPSSPLRIRELHNAFRLIAEPLPQVHWRGEALPDNAQTLPLALISVGHDGRFSSFSPELLGQSAAAYADFVIGNVADGGYLDAARRSLAFASLWRAVLQGTRACRAGCAHFAYCGGGAPVNKFYENGDVASAETLYCRSMIKRPFDAVLARLERDIAATAATRRPAPGARRPGGRIPVVDEPETAR